MVKVNIVSFLLKPSLELRPYQERELMFVLRDILEHSIAEIPPPSGKEDIDAYLDRLKRRIIHHLGFIGKPFKEKPEWVKKIEEAIGKPIEEAIEEPGAKIESIVIIKGVDCPFEIVGFPIWAEGDASFRALLKNLPAIAGWKKRISFVIPYFESYQDPLVREDTSGFGLLVMAAIPALIGFVKMIIRR